VERLSAWLPGLAAHACSSGPADPFLEHLRRGTCLAHVVAHVTLELQRQVEFPVTFGRVEGTGDYGVYGIIVAYGEEEPARSALEIALRLVLAALADQPFDLAGELQRLLELADQYRLDPSATAIVEAARHRDIPALRLTPPGQLVQLGWGVHQKRIKIAETSHTSALAKNICKEKTLANRLLSALGIPVPAGRAVASADAAWEAAQANSGEGSWWSSTSRAEIIASWWSMAPWWRQRAVIRPRWWAMDSVPCVSWSRSSIATHAGVHTAVHGIQLSWTRRPRSRCDNRAWRSTLSPRRVRRSGCGATATCRRAGRRRTSRMTSILAPRA
jgi:hypothetical protein